jgi:hypothetical protein
MTTYVLCFFSGWALGSLAIYSYIVLARGDLLRESEGEEDGEAPAEGAA